MKIPRRYKPHFAGLEHLVVERLHKSSHGLLAMVLSPGGIDDEDGDDKISIVFVPAAAPAPVNGQSAFIVLAYFDLGETWRRTAESRFEDLSRPDLEGYLLLASQVAHQYGVYLNGVVDALPIPGGFVALTEHRTGGGLLIERVDFEQSGHPRGTTAALRTVSTSRTSLDTTKWNKWTGRSELYVAAAAIQREEPNDCMHTPSLKWMCGVLDLEIRKRRPASSLIAMSTAIDRLSMSELDTAHTALQFCAHHGSDSALIPSLLQRGASLSLDGGYCAIASALEASQADALLALIDGVSALELNRWCIRNQQLLAKADPQMEQGLSMIRAKRASNAAQLALDELNLGSTPPMPRPATDQLLSPGLRPSGDASSTSSPRP